MPKRTAACLLILAAAPAVSWAQVAAGPEFRANSYTTGIQSFPVVAAAASGNFVVVWNTMQGASLDIAAQRYDASGAARGAEFRVNTYTTSLQQIPAIASDAPGNFVVAWSSRDQDGSGDGVFAQRFDASGQARGSEFRVNTYTTSNQFLPAVAVDASGNFVVAWMSLNQDGSGNGVFARRFGGSGQGLGSEFRVNTYTTAAQGDPALAFDASGNFVVVWTGDSPTGTRALAQRYDALGAPRGGEFAVNAYTTSLAMLPSVASRANGDLVFTWSAGGLSDVFARRFNASGAPQDTEFRVNTVSASQQLRSSVAAAANGGFVVAWDSLGQDGSLYGVFAQRYDALAAPRGAEFRVNTATTNNQYYASMTSDGTGNYVVAWQSIGQDGSVTGVFAQRLGGLNPLALAADPTPGGGTDGNGVLEPGEGAIVRPSWRNSTGAQQSLGGTASSFSGPAGATYTIVDGTGAYVLNDGVTAPCSDCYELAVSNPPTRPALHWDASFQETLLPPVHGQTKSWRLHLGDSFTDVPRSNPFYRFIETLLHHSVTGGCGTLVYCPANATARDQMSVFVLIAKEGVGFTPPACTTPVFGDVPASNPFCRFIEELARRGVVSGCGGGNYCPAQPVTREQMAVFVLRTLDPTLNPPACTTPMFNDVPASSAFCRWVEELARRGVVSGCGGGNYCPAGAVTREQMGVFIGATFGLTLYGP